MLHRLKRLSHLKNPHVLTTIPYESFYMEGIHGIAHAYRVLQLVQLISAAEGLNKYQKDLLEFCAIFHDIGRINDLRDDFHGKRTISVLKENTFFGFTKFDVPLVHYIISSHCITDSMAYEDVRKYKVADSSFALKMLKIFKDSDKTQFRGIIQNSALEY